MTEAEATETTVGQEEATEADLAGGQSDAAQSRADEAGGQEDPELVAKDSEIREALRRVIDPEIGIDVVTLGLIRQINFADDETEVIMILTTPFCPYGGMLVQQVKGVTKEVVGGEVTVTMGEENWSPEMMEGDLEAWGLI